ncbi:iron-sulfur cluster assembly scaffold protein [Actibacterium sp. 188UL27-1]|uniref:iron-sulfur cluster assembly scaffold protein n=1 Tax=Actibacterium sp. 188UL27-1 TaxID=2786961 RepID=UPI00195AC214|nr:iron-sulfur cluster assembly scaffold protein [Actibacterium sp. 188UL27-1]MBM7067698.1 iron-sulfur cluster assembly scaffold protein [Actibacterium sp. 188UL27-1]
MGTDSDLVKLYSGRILALASDIPLVGRLDTPDTTAKRRSPLCGSTVTVDLCLDGDRVTDFRQEVKACALGQAAAAVLAQNVIGRTEAELVTARDALRAMLKDDGPVPAAPFDGFDVLKPAVGFKNRHASILLALEATTDALQAVGQASATR